MANCEILVEHTYPQVVRLAIPQIALRRLESSAGRERTSKLWESSLRSEVSITSIIAIACALCWLYHSSSIEKLVDFVRSFPRSGALEPTHQLN